MSDDRERDEVDETGSVIPFPNLEETELGDEEFTLADAPFAPEAEDESEESEVDQQPGVDDRDVDESSLATEITSEDERGDNLEFDVEPAASVAGPDDAAPVIELLTERPAEPGFDVDDGADEAEQAAFDAFTSDDYVRATTAEYEDLAKEVEQAGTREHAPVAHAVGMPGVGSGVVGFEDVTGESEPVVVEAEASDLTLRVVSALVVLALFFGSLWLGAPWFGLLVGLVALVAVVEFYFSVQQVGFRPMVLLGVLGSAAVLVSGWWGQNSALLAIAGTTGAALLGIVLWYALMPRSLPLENASLTFLGLVWVASMLAFAMPIARAEDWQILIAFIVVVNAGFDIGSYFSGRAWGKTALAPELSPKKTIEGVVGGIALALAAALGMALLFDVLVPLDAIVMMAVVVVFALLGDLSESFVKRALGVKDMGTVLPGHGGVIDRIDGLLLVVPAMYFTLDLLGYL